MEFIKIRGARTHNLKNINLDLPRNRLPVITGLSGSGKSSLAFDTLYAEGQRRYVESPSGGEPQRIRLASQIGSGLTGVMYVLDEPPIVGADGPAVLDIDWGMLAADHSHCPLGFSTEET